MDAQGARTQPGDKQLRTTATPSQGHPHAAIGLSRSPWAHVVQAAAALAAGMGVGRFVYTPLLPLMHTQAGLSSGAGANLTTADYMGVPDRGSGRDTASRPGAFRGRAAWLQRWRSRLPRGHAADPQHHRVASAAAGCGGVQRAHLRGRRQFPAQSSARPPRHLPGLAFGGVAAGIALSGVLVLILRTVGDWETASWASAGLAVALSAAAWGLRPEPVTRPAASAFATGRRAAPAHPPLAQCPVRFLHAGGCRLLIAGTFLVAAIEQTSPAGSAAAHGCWWASRPFRSPRSGRHWDAGGLDRTCCWPRWPCRPWAPRWSAGSPPR